MTAPLLDNLGPREQLRAGRLGLRLGLLLLGLVGFGVSLALQIRAGLGTGPWDVLHVALAHRTGLLVGTISIIVSFLLLLLWIPLRQLPGLGTVANAVVVGLAANAGLAVIPPIHGLGWQVLGMVVAVVANGIAGAVYIGAQFGPGPRDGLMTGLHEKTGLSIRLVRTAIEVAVLVVGWILGGPVGVGTVVYALGVGLIVHWVLPRVVVRPVPRPAVEDEDATGR